MKESLGCALAGVLILLVLLVLFFFVGMIEPGFAILIMIVGIFVAAGTMVAFVLWLIDLATSRRS